MTTAGSTWRALDNRNFALFFAGQGLSLVWQRPNRTARLIVAIVLGTHTLADLWLVSRQTVFDPW
ncbi:MAG: hypothetical protein ABJB49_05710, partial [Nitrospirota bacterium]